mgnify:CR=1 FL=1
MITLGYITEQPTTFFNVVTPQSFCDVEAYAMHGQQGKISFASIAAHTAHGAQWCTPICSIDSIGAIFCSGTARSVGQMQNALTSNLQAVGIAMQSGIAHTVNVAILQGNSAGRLLGISELYSAKLGAGYVAILVASESVTLSAAPESVQIICTV